MQTDQVFLQILVMGLVVIGLGLFGAWVEQRQHKDESTAD